MGASISRRVEAVFNAAMELAPAARADFVRQTCREDDALRGQVEALLEAAGLATNYFNSFAERLGLVAILEDDFEPPQRDLVGPYRLIRLLGRGGMGAVYLAERADEQFDKRVALKLLPAGVSSAEMRHRFLSERQILAGLVHPNIARLLDGGITDQGAPYFVMDYVEGMPIDEYCDEHRLGVGQRLSLFRKVCDAVEYAHRNLIVHRDLKPGNVLVEASGDVKLLDFGIAKVLDPQTTSQLTLVGRHPMTPLYASPEMIRGEPVTTAADVYSLGVLLYELLTGSRPYQLKYDSAGALEEAILAADPSRPSETAETPAVRRALRGDLDTIILKALKKDPAERYATVHALSDDLERHLSGEAVLARPDSAVYRLRKFMGRNKVTVGAAASILLAILTGAALAIWQARVAVAERERAEEVKEFIASVFQDANLEEGDGLSLTAVDLLKRAKARIDRSLGTSPEGRVELLNIIGLSLMSLRDTTTTEEVLNQAVEEATQHLGADHIMTLRTRLSRAWPLMYRGKTRQMHDEVDAVLPALEQHPSTEAQDLVLAWRLRLHGAIEEGNYSEAELAGRKALELAEAGLSDDHPDKLLALVDLATAYSFGNKPAQALDAAARAFRQAPRVYADNPQHPNMLLARNEYARALGDNGELEGAIAQFKEVLRDKIELYGPANLTTGLTYQNLMTYELDAGRLKDALEHTERALAIFTKHTEPASYNIASAVNARGVTLLRARQGAKALADLMRTRDAAIRLFGPTHRNALHVRANYALALAYTGKVSEALVESQSIVDQLRRSGEELLYQPLHINGVLQRMAGDYAGSLLVQQEALALAEREPSTRRDRDVRLNRAWSLTEIGVTKLETGEYEGATAALEQALTVFASFRSEIAPDHADVLVGLGRARIEQKRLDEGVAFLERADAFWRDFDAENRWAGEAALWLGRGYALLGRNGDARKALARAERILSRSPISTDSKLLRLAHQS